MDEDLVVKRERVRLATLSLVEQKGYAIGKEVAMIAGISHSSASMFLNHDYREWGLTQVEDESCNATIKRHKYVKDQMTSKPYPFKCDTPCIPNLASLFTEEDKIQDSKTNLHESFNTAALKAQMNHDSGNQINPSQKMASYLQSTNSKPQKQIEPVQITTNYSQSKETLDQKVRRIADNLQRRGKKEIDLLILMKNIEREIGTVDMESVIKTLNHAKYRWK
jgi:hypothetical protein